MKSPRAKSSAIFIGANLIFLTGTHNNSPLKVYILLQTKTNKQKRIIRENNRVPIDPLYLKMRLKKKWHNSITNFWKGRIARQSRGISRSRATLLSMRLSNLSQLQTIFQAQSALLLKRICLQILRSIFKTSSKKILLP